MSDDHVTQRQLYEYVDGQLESTKAEAVERHLAGCAGCAEQVEALDTLLEELASLPAGIPPAEDLWPDIAARTRQRSRPGVRQDNRPLSTQSVRRALWMARAPLAAAAVVLILVTTAVNWAFMAGTVDPAGALSESASGPRATRLADDAWLHDYATAIEDLTLALEEKRARLSPEAVRILEDNLRVIDRAIAESLAALGREPSNDTARKTVVYAHARKLDLLRRAVEAEEQI